MNIPHIILAFLILAIVGCTAERPHPHEEVARHEEADPHALFEQANAEFASGEFEIAAGTFSRCIEAANQRNIKVHFSVYGSRGLSHYKIGEFTQALDDTTKALATIDRQVEPRDVLARLFYQRAMIYVGLKDERSATRDFATALEYDPDQSLDPRTH